MHPFSRHESEPEQGNESDRRPWLSAEADSSNPETLNEVPLRGDYALAGDNESKAMSSSLKLGRLSVDSANPRTSSTAQRLAELRAEMKTNREQIDQLTEAHRAIQDAVSGVHATQDLLTVAPHRTVNAAALNAAALGRMASTRTTASKYSQLREEDDRPDQPFKQPAGLDRQGWVDDEYYEHNPWYGQAKDKPVYSLGKPLPHTQRFAKKKKKSGKGKRAQEDVDIEKGQADGATAKSPKKSKRVQIADEGSGGGGQQEEGDEEYHEGTSSQHRDPSSEGEKAPGYQDGSKYKVDGEPVGQREDDEAEKGGRNPDDLRNWWARLRNKYPEPLAEFLATFMSTFLGICATISVNLSSTQETQYGTYETACWAWGFAFMIGIYIGGGVSGAHMNPAISICLSLFRGFPWRQCGLYIAVQFLASITAAALAYAVYFDVIHYVDPNLETSYTCFFSYPQDWVSNGGALLSQVVAGAVMTIAVFALGDDQNNPPGAGMHAVVLGFLQAAMKFSLGYNTGSALNAASDFGPRVVAYAVGYRTPKIFTNAWWIYGPWAGALAGSIAGCVAYDLFIFVGSESPVNYRIPKAFRRRTNQLKDLTRKF